MIHCTRQGLKKTWIQACPLSKQFSHFFSRYHFLCALVNFLLENELPAPFPIGQVNFNSYSPSKEINLPRTTGRDYFQTLLHTHEDLH